MVWSSLKYQNPKTLKLVLILYLSHSLVMYPVQFDNKGKHWHLLYWHLLLKSYRHSLKKMSEWIISKICCKNVFIISYLVYQRKSHTFWFTTYGIVYRKKSHWTTTIISIYTIRGTEFTWNFGQIFTGTIKKKVKIK